MSSPNMERAWSIIANGDAASNSSASLGMSTAFCTSSAQKEIPSNVSSTYKIIKAANHKFQISDELRKKEADNEVHIPGAAVVAETTSALRFGALSKLVFLPTKDKLRDETPNPPSWVPFCPLNVDPARAQKTNKTTNTNQPPKLGTQLQAKSQNQKILNE